MKSLSHREMTAFCALLASKMQQFANIDGPAAEECDEIAMFRLAQRLDADPASEEFMALWGVVTDDYCEMMAPDRLGTVGDTYVPAPAELQGLPLRDFLILPYDKDGRNIRYLRVSARTTNEALRHLRQTGVEAAGGVSVIPLWCTKAEQVDTTWGAYGEE